MRPCEMIVAGKSYYKEGIELSDRLLAVSGGEFDIRVAN